MDPVGGITGSATINYKKIHNFHFLALFDIRMKYET